jgi:hypothetical protein
MRRRSFWRSDRRESSRCEAEFLVEHPTHNIPTVRAEHDRSIDLRVEKREHVLRNLHIPYQVVRLPVESRQVADETMP